MFQFCNHISILLLYIQKERNELKDEAEGVYSTYSIFIFACCLQGNNNIEYNITFLLTFQDINIITVCSFFAGGHMKSNIQLTLEQKLKKLSKRIGKCSKIF